MRNPKQLGIKKEAMLLRVWGKTGAALSNTMRIV
jgi:hypothetical protein